MQRTRAWVCSQVWVEPILLPPNQAWVCRTSSPPSNNSWAVEIHLQPIWWWSSQTTQSHIRTRITMLTLTRTKTIRGTIHSVELMAKGHLKQVGRGMLTTLGSTMWALMSRKKRKTIYRNLKTFFHLVQRHSPQIRTRATRKRSIWPIILVCLLTNHRSHPSRSSHSSNNPLPLTLDSRLHKKRYRSQHHRMTYLEI